MQKITKTDIQKAKIPSAELIVEKRKEQLLRDIQAVLDGKKYLEHYPFVEEILKKYAPEAVIAALLRLHYEESFNPDSYGEISEVKVDNAGKTRLFIALGRKMGYTPRSLVDFLVQEARLKAREIDDVRVMDDFSFVTLPFLEAEHLLHTFKTQKVKGKSLITKAKSPRDQNTNKTNSKRRPRR